MADTYKIATLNVNGVSVMMRMRILAEFLHKHEIVIILLQEVTHDDFDVIRGNNVYTNVGIKKRDTAMLTSQTIQSTNITRLSSGRGMAAFCRGVWIENIYAPSGSSNRQEREKVYNVGLTHLLRSLSQTTIIVGILTASWQIPTALGI